MKITLERLRKIVRGVVKEAAPDGQFQRYAKGTYKKMIKTASSGGNKNTPPFTKKPSRPGKSGPDDSEYVAS